jgi:hypothetical protein
MIGASYNLWSSYVVLHTLPPLPSLPAGVPPSDPAQEMLAAVRAEGGCLEFSGRYDDRWVIMRAGGGVVRFPSPIGHRLASQGLICRHPGDLPGHDKAFVRFVPRERMPAGFEFDLAASAKQMKADTRRLEVLQRIQEREEWLATRRAANKARRGRAV